MSSILVTYRSKTGFSEFYADIIAKKLGVEAREWGSVDRKTLGDYDIVIYGAGVYAGKINGLRDVRKHVDTAKLCLFATGGTLLEKDRNYASTLWDKNIPEYDVPHFYFPAGINYEKMCFRDRTLLRIGARIMDTQKDKRNYEYTLRNSYNVTDPEYVTELIRCVKNWG